MSGTSTAAPRRDESVLDVLNTFYSAWLAHDPDAMAGVYTDDATVALPGAFLRGRDAVRAWFSTGFAGRLKGSSPVDESREVRFAGPDAAIVTSQGGTLMAGEASIPPERLIRATWVLSRQGGDWLIAAYHNCAS